MFDVLIDHIARNYRWPVRAPGHFYGESEGLYSGDDETKIPPDSLWKYTFIRGRRTSKFLDCTTGDWAV